MQKRWLINKRYPEQFAREFPELSPVTLQLLWDKGITNQALVDEFFNPDYEEDMHDPFLMKGMSKAVKRIFRALERDEKILVYGDYDVDGVTASVIMISAFVELKSVVCQMEKDEAEKFVGVYIPDRELEGYGLNEKAIRKIREEGTDLIVTVDCGISNFSSVKLAQELGMDVIITDHHHVLGKVPEALAVINPKQESCLYPFKDLSGAGIAFKVVQALFRNLRSGKYKNLRDKKAATVGFEKWFLDLAAVGTIADCVNLVGENRTLTKYGLLVLNKTRRIGLKKLIGRAGIAKRGSDSGAGKQKLIDAHAVGFMLAPRLNAAGRMDHANTSYKLLVAESEEEAEKLVLKLEGNNRSRQKLTEQIIEEIKERMKKYDSLPKVVVEQGEGWKVGIVGLVAGKLVEEYSRPFLVLQKREKESIGSGRSIPEFNLIEAIEKCRDILLEFGGHSQAAGLRIKNENLEEFKKRINSIANEVLKDEYLVPSINIDCKVEPAQINWRLFDEIEKFHPFGQGNEKPIFLVENLEVYEVRTVGNGDSHLKLSLKTTSRSNLKNVSGEERKAKFFRDDVEKHFSAIGFGLGELVKKMPGSDRGLRWGDIVDVVFQLEVNEWNGNRELQMNVLDLKISSQKRNL